MVFVNGFNLGRYWKVGPQNTLYLPAPLLHEGTNEVIVTAAVVFNVLLLALNSI